MDLTKLVIQTAIKQTGITPGDMENVRLLITALNELPARIAAIEGQLKRIESNLSNLNQED